MKTAHKAADLTSSKGDVSIGRIVSVTGSKAILMLDGLGAGRMPGAADRPEMGTLLAIDTINTVVLAIVSGLSVPVPAHNDSETEVWIAELGLVGELWKRDGRAVSFNRGVTIYPMLGDRARVANKGELELAFCGDTRNSVRVGFIKQDASIPAMVRVDDLLGKHFAILGTTGTGKSCTTALVLRSILDKNPAAHIVLLDPHNEYATAFGDWAEVISPRNMQLPFWLLTFEEISEVLVADPSRKNEIEILQELIPIAKSRYSAGRNNDKQAVRRGVLDHGRFTVDTPVPYRISDLTALIDERMGKLENKKDLTPYRNLKHRIDAISQDSRFGFMFGSLTVYDGMAQILGRIFRVPVNNKPITILELTGLPTEIVSVVVSVLCRMTFDFALWSEGKVPVTLVCEEAHRYVPADASLGFEPCKRSIAKIAKEGRKYGASLCIVTQRPAEIDPTILSQCNTVFALRMSNDRDQAIVHSAVSDTGSGLLEFLPALGQREAIAFGDGVPLPVRIRFDELPANCLPRSSTARFSERWQASVGDENMLELVVEKWRNSGAAGGETNNMAMMAEALGIPDGHEPEPIPAHQIPRVRDSFDPPRAPMQQAAATAPAGPAMRSDAEPGQLGTSRRLDQLLRRDGQPAPSLAPPARPGPALRRPGAIAGQPQAAAAPAAPAAPPPQPARAEAAAGGGGALRSLRERLISRN